jgi:hypothetical protein
LNGDDIMTTVRRDPARASAGPDESSSIVTEEQAQQLPVPVRRMLHIAGVIGRPVPAAVRLRQRGHIRIGRGWPWLPFEARQVFTTDPPCFIWRAAMKPLLMFPVNARDAFLGGHGRMTVRLGRALTIVDARGPELDQGELLRFLGELPWFPAACVLPYLHWEPIDDASARVTMTIGDVTASAILRIPADGSRIKVSADRCWTADKSGGRLVPWSGTHTSFRQAAGLLLPERAEVTWHLPDGDFTYFRATVSQIEYATANPVVR